MRGCIRCSDERLLLFIWGEDTAQVTANCNDTNSFQKRLNLLRMWQEIDNKLIWEYQFESFAAAFSFLNEVAALAAQVNHHPTIINEYTRVRLELTTHDAGNIITELDRQLAEAIDQKWAQGSSE